MNSARVTLRLGSNAESLVPLRICLATNSLIAAAAQLVAGTSLNDFVGSCTGFPGVASGSCDFAGVADGVALVLALLQPALFPLAVWKTCHQ